MHLDVDDDTEDHQHSHEQPIEKCYSDGSEGYGQKFQGPKRGRSKKMEAPTKNFVPLQMRRKPPLKKQDSKSKKKRNLRAQWTDEALKEAIQAIDDGYTMEEVSIHYSIPRTSLRDHIEHQIR